MLYRFYTHFVGIKSIKFLPIFDEIGFFAFMFKTYFKKSEVAQIIYVKLLSGSHEMCCTHTFVELKP